MPKPEMIAPIIIQRYRDMLIAMDDENDEWEDTYWLRFAAQVVVTKTGEPAGIAEAIRLTARELDVLADWFRDFSSPARFVVAAMLVQFDVPIIHLVAWRLQAQALLAEVGLACDAFTLTMTALILNLHPDPTTAGKPVVLHEAHRLKEIHDRLKRLHRWLIGPGDIPAFAALLHCHLSPEVMVARVEDTYQELLSQGLQPGHDLQTAANLLALTGLTSAAAAQRCQGIIRSLEFLDGPIDADDYGAMAVLSLVGEPPGRLIERFMSIRESLGQCDPDLQGTQALTTISADFTVLALLSSDDDPGRHSAPERMAASGTLHAFRLASAVMISQIDRDLIGATGDHKATGWPGGI